MRTIAERFLAKFTKSNSGCWNWTAGRDQDGYGQFKILPDWAMRAHRFSYLFFVGAIPIGLKVLHRCDNPPCVNPGHLFLGTDLDNARDCIEKGRRHAKKPVERKENADGGMKIDAVDALLIKWCLADKLPQRKIGRSFGISQKMVSHISRGRSWGTITHWPG